MNESSPHKRDWPTSVLVVLTVAALAACLSVAVFLYLPRLVTSRLPVDQIRRLGFDDFTGRVSSIGLRRTTAGPFIFGTPGQPVLAMDSIVFDYRPGELRRKKIRRIRVDRATVNVSLGSDGLTLPGLNLDRLATKAPAVREPSEASAAAMETTVEKIEIRGGMVNLSWRNAVYKIAFEADLKADKAGMTTFTAQVRLFPRGQQLAMNARVDLEHRKASINLDGPLIALDRFSDLIHLIPGLEATGIVTVRARATLNFAPVGITDVNVNLTWGGGRLVYASAKIEPGPGKTPAVLSAVSDNLDTLQIKVGGVKIQAPVPIVLNSLMASADLAGKMCKVGGSSEMTVLPFSSDRKMPFSLKNTLFLPLRFDASQTASGEWFAEIGTVKKKTNANLDPLDLTVAKSRIHATPPRFSLTASGDRQGATANWQMDVDTIRASAAGLIVDLPAADANGELQFKQESHGFVWGGDARIQFPSATLNGGGMAGKFNALNLSARFEQQGPAAPVVDARMRFSNGRFDHAGSGLHLAGGRLDLPFHSLPKAAGSHGSFSVARVVHNGRLLGNIQGQVTQKKDAYFLAATHGSDLFPGMIAAFTGTVRTHETRFPNAAIRFQIPSYDLPAASDLGRLLPTAQGVTLSGTVSAQGNAFISPKGIRGDADFVMQAGSMQMVQKRITLEGINTALRFPELPRIRSAPAQQIQFSRAAMGSIVVDGGSLDVQVESGKTLFVEKGRLNWCGGKVDAGSLRITAGKQDYQVSLYCQRLGLSQILEQLGSVNARGTGTLNGRIPIAFSNGTIRFDDGFLFSTPGEGGQIQLSGTEVLTRGIPAGTPQMAQVELAREALKDYNYDWAKLGLVSEGEDFVMRLQFDGKPAHPLPFVYKKEIGSFVRVEADAQGSVFTGIGLDVNLRLPLNQLMQYKDIVNMIE